MSRPLALPRLTSEHAAQRNAIFRRRVAVPMHWLGQEWTWSLQPLHASSWQGAWLEAEWGEARACTTVPRSLLLDLAGALLRSGQLLDLPPALRLAVAETAFATLSEAVESASRRRMRFLSMGEEVPNIAGMQGLAWEMRSDVHTHTGELWLSHAGVVQLASAFERLVHGVTMLNDLSALPITIRFCAGQTTVRMSALARLAARDVILFDESWISQDGAVTICVGG